jgi:hypothetical protein
VNEPISLICEVAEAPLAVPGSDFSHVCGQCGRRVMIAPSGQRVLAENPGRVAILCRSCWEPEPVGVVGLAAPAREIAGEIRRAVGNLWRRRN